MNILPFVLALLTVIGIVSISEFNRALSTSKNYTLSNACLRGNWAVHGKAQKRLYMRTMSKKSQSEHIEEEKEELYFRDAWVGSHASSLNLYPLIKDTERNQPLFEIVCRYFAKIYTPLFPAQPKERDNLIKKLLTLILNAQQESLSEQKKLLSLAEIELPDKKLYDLYYTLMRGTHPYDLNTLEGYPPLREVVTFSVAKKSSIPFNRAHPALLEVLLGEKVVVELTEREKELITKNEKLKMKNTPLKESELRALINELNASVQEEYLGLLSYRKAADSPPIFWIDKETNIAIRYDPHDKKRAPKKPAQTQKSLGKH